MLKFINLKFFILIFSGSKSSKRDEELGKLSWFTNWKGRTLFHLSQFDKLFDISPQ